METLLNMGSRKNQATHKRSSALLSFDNPDIETRAEEAFPR